MKVLTLTQPWATLVAIGAKRFETRSWPTAYRGPLLIHAAKGFPADARAVCRLNPFDLVLERAGFQSDRDLPLGVLLCETSILGCRQTVSVWPDIGIDERGFGDYSPGRFAFELGPIERVLEPPIAARGALGLWSWPTPGVSLTADLQDKLFA